LSKRRAFSVIALLTKSASIVVTRARRGRLRLLEQVQEAPRVAVGIADQRIDRLVVEREAVERNLLRALEQLTHLVVVERLQHVHLRARQQRRVDLEARILGGRADEGHEPRLDERQQCILLRLVEAVDFVDEQDRVAAGAIQRVLRLLHRLADVLHAAEHRRQRDELAVERERGQARQRRLADARRPPQDHRMRLAGFEGQRSGLPSPSRCVWPITSASVFGRSASASGRRGST
jgi:hypothetical protein